MYKAYVCFCVLYPEASFWLASATRTPLRRARSARSTSPVPRPGVARSLNFMPAHLPLSPVADVPPNGPRSEKRWASRLAAWELTEWIVAFLTFYEFNCPKTFGQLEASLGAWHVTTLQNKFILELFEGTISFCRTQSSDGWSRGRNTV